MKANTARQQSVTARNPFDLLLREMGCDVQSDLRAHESTADHDRGGRISDALVLDLKGTAAVLYRRTLGLDVRPI